jgi:hypothetical protein
MPIHRGALRAPRYDGDRSPHVTLTQGRTHCRLPRRLLSSTAFQSCLGKILDQGANIPDVRIGHSLPEPSNKERMGKMANSKYTLESVSNMVLTGMTCEQCDEMFQECIGEVDPDFPGGYEVCQLLWDRCKSECGGTSKLTRADTRIAVKRAYAQALSRT